MKKSQNSKKKQRGKKPRSMVQSAKKRYLPDGKTVPQSARLRSNFNTVVNRASFMPGDFDFDISHTFKQVALVDGKKTGTLLSGCCPIGEISYVASSPTNPIDPLNTAYSAGPQSVLYLNPRQMFPDNSIEDRESGNYGRFRFRKLVVVYGGGVATNSNARFQLGYYPDGSVNNPDITLGFMYAQPGTMKCQVWTPRKSCDVSALLPDDLYYCDADAGGGDSGFRQSYQGAITGFWNSVPSTETIQGDLWIDYELELWDSCTFADLALSSRKPRQLRRRPVEVPAPISKSGEVAEALNEGAHRDGQLVYEDQVVPMDEFRVWLGQRKERVSPSRRSESKERKSSI